MEKSGRPRTALNECVKVVVRCRPLSEKEKNEGYDEQKAKRRAEQKWYERLSTKTAVDIAKLKTPVQVVKVWPERGAVQVYNPKGQDKLFTYDAAYDADADTQTIYDEMVRPLVASVLDGFNGCVFAYGQTGTGKTHTMEGTDHHEGIIPRAFRHLWAHIENTASPDVTHLVSCSYVELYLEDVKDLLAKDCKKLTIRGQELNGFYIPEMTSVVCKSAAEMVRVMRSGNKHRTAGRTDMNEHSSRSHAVFLVTVETAHRTTDRIRSDYTEFGDDSPPPGHTAPSVRPPRVVSAVTTVVTSTLMDSWLHLFNYHHGSVGKLNLVDLAGSERQRKTGAGAERLREAARINQALSTLGNVISALAENSPHVPYRDSKLTRILQDSLGGNSKTIMIANIGPASYNYDETITTLRYAHRAKAIKNKPVRNEDPKDAKLREYQAEIERLRALIQARRRVPRAPPTADPAPDPDPAPATEPDDPVPAPDEATILQEKSKTEELENQIRSLEERLVRGGGGAGKDLLNDLNQSQIILEQRHLEIAERKKREIEMQQKIDLEEETTAIVTNTFTTLQQEVDHKNQRLKKCVSKYAWLREEMVEQREAHDAERREHEALQAALVGELRRRLLLADSFVPAPARAARRPLAYDEDTDRWHWDTDHCVAEPLRARPVAGGRRRPACLEALAPGAPPALRADDLLDLLPLPLPPTTRAYPRPHLQPPPRAAKEKPVKKETTVVASATVTHAGARRATSRPRPGTAHHRLGTAGVR